MNTELQMLIDLVKASKEPVQTVVENYFKSVTWSVLKSEYEVMTKSQKSKLIKKLEGERK